MKLSRFRISNYRNVIDSGWIETTSVTAFVGQNEAGKSNLFEALHRLHPYDDADYDPDEDWPVDDWKGRKNAKGNVVSRALFAFEEDEATELFEFATVPPEGGAEDEEEEGVVVAAVPKGAQLFAQHRYGFASAFYVADSSGEILEHEKLNLSTEKVREWAQENVPKFVLIQDYEFAGAQVELD